MTTKQLTVLRIELARRGMTQFDLAKKLGRPVSTLSSWLRGVAPPPSDLITRIEHALHLPAGALSRTGASRRVIVDMATEIGRAAR